MGSRTNAGEGAEKQGDQAHGRRNFLKLILTLGGLATVGSFASMFRVLMFVPSANLGATSNVPLAWPSIKIANISTLDPAKPLWFNYPLVDTPCVLLKVGQKADNGVGPDSDIVAFSGICQHLGCLYSVVPTGSSPACNESYKASESAGYCCCHGSIYDLVDGAKVIGGPSPRPVPQVILNYDSATGDINAVGMSAPTIFGHGPPGTSNPSLLLQYDLTGGDIVTEATVFS